MLERQVARLTRALQQTAAFARSTAPPNDSGPVQTIQGQMDALSRRDGMPVLFHYGFSSAMPVGGDKLVTYLGGDRSKPVVVATGHQSYRLTGLATGEVVLHDMWGRSIKLSASGPVINGNGAAVMIQGDLHVSGAVIGGYGGGDQVNLQTHKHGTGSAAPGTSAPTAGT